MSAPTPIEAPTTFAQIRVRAEHADSNSDGTWTLTIPTLRPTEAEHELIARLFPNLTEHVYELLNREMLLAAIVRR
jgi:hypothetical protein